MATGKVDTTNYLAALMANESVIILRNWLVMAALVNRDYDDSFAKRGKSVTTRRPKLLTSKLWTGQPDITSGLVSASIETELPDADPVTVTLNKYRYTSFIVEDEPAVTAVKDLAAEFAEPAMAPIAEGVDDDILTEMITGTGLGGSSPTAVADGTVASAADFNGDDIIAAKRAMDTNKVPKRGRQLVMSSEHANDVLKDDLFVQAQQAGTTDGLREALIGRAFKFTTWETQNVPNYDDSTDDKPQSIAFHPAALTLATRPLAAIPAGRGAQSAFAMLDNVSMRVVISYNNGAQGTEITSAVLYGVKLIDEDMVAPIVP